MYPCNTILAILHHRYKICCRALLKGDDTIEFRLSLYPVRFITIQPIKVDIWGQFHQQSHNLSGQIIVMSKMIEQTFLYDIWMKFILEEISTIFI